MKISIVCGEKHCGKTTFLQNEFLKKSDIELSQWTGFFTPIIENERNFVFVQNYESLNIECIENQEDGLSVGRFVFSKKAFEKAINYIQNDLSKGIKNLLIDEIGPLELNGKGFNDLLLFSLTLPLNQLQIVVRNELVNTVIKHYNLERFELEIYQIKI